MEQKYFYIIGGLLLICLYLIFKLRKPSSKFDINTSSQLIDALGGYENILEYDFKVSRIGIVLKNIENADLELVRDISKCGLAVVGSKIQLILKENSESFKQVLKDLEMSDNH